MSNVFAKKQTASTSTAIDEDFVGGGFLFDTDVYEATIKAMYQTKSLSSDALAINLILNVQGREVREQVWVTDSKGKVTYKDKTTGEEKNLPGFSQINALCLLVTGKDLGSQEVEDRVVKVYDFDAKKELPKQVPCFSDLHDQTVFIALQRITEDKTKKDEKTGNYVSTGETRDINKIVKFFGGSESNLVTSSEVAEYIRTLGGNIDEVINDGHFLKAVNKAPRGAFVDKWLEAHKGKTYNKAKKNTNNVSEFSKAGSSNTKAQTSSLFDD